MINKRLLIKHLLAHNDENSFYDKKRKISLGSKEGKAKFLKHICAVQSLGEVPVSSVSDLTVVETDEESRTREGLQRALDHKNRLLRFDRQVPSNQWFLFVCLVAFCFF